MSDRLQLTYGARLEATEFRGAPGYNPTLDSLFGVRTDRIPREVHASPRFGFTWTLATESGGAGGAGGAGGPGGAGRAVPRSILRGGVGAVRAVPPVARCSAALGARGRAPGGPPLD